MVEEQQSVCAESCPASWGWQPTVTGTYRALHNAENAALLSQAWARNASRAHVLLLRSCSHRISCPGEPASTGTADRKGFCGGITLTGMSLTMCGPSDCEGGWLLPAHQADTSSELSWTQSLHTALRACNACSTSCWRQHQHQQASLAAFCSLAGENWQRSTASAGPHCGSSSTAETLTCCAQS